MKNSNEEIIKALEEIKIKRESKVAGICYNLTKICAICGYSIVEKYCVGWKDIIEENIDPLEDYENHLIGKWEGENYTLRCDLIDHIINRLKNENVTDEFIWSL